MSDKKFIRVKTEFLAESSMNSGNHEKEHKPITSITSNSWGSMFREEYERSWFTRSIHRIESTFKLEKRLLRLNRLHLDIITTNHELTSRQGFDKNPTKRQQLEEHLKKTVNDYKKLYRKVQMYHAAHLVHLPAPSSFSSLTCSDATQSPTPQAWATSFLSAKAYGNNYGPSIQTLQLPKEEVKSADVIATSAALKKTQTRSTSPYPSTIVEYLIRERDKVISRIQSSQRSLSPDEQSSCIDEDALKFIRLDQELAYLGVLSKQSSLSSVGSDVLKTYKHFQPYMDQSIEHTKPNYYPRSRSPC